ncbi:MAG: hypothetical protein IJD82_11015 [Clostridia bacterium]|nr:hypothetical protein [Clostridia bacterium]
MKFSAEQISKAQNAKSTEELIALAKEEQIELTPEEAQMYFAQLAVPSGEMSDDELDAVSGGGCGGSSAPKTPADYGFPNGQRVYAYNDICPKCSDHGFYNPSNNFTLEWIDSPGGNYQLRCEICGGVTHHAHYCGDPSVRFKKV